MTELLGRAERETVRERARLALAGFQGFLAGRGRNRPAPARREQGNGHAQ
ncbi:MAG TPA: hypothetical protein VHN16_17295 [Streptosporangiaceae bacterium]|nr:hypothetical protein [Streptosporangiaceae bacterium]